MEQAKQAIRTKLDVHGLKQAVDQSDESKGVTDFSDRVLNVLGKRASFNPMKDA